MARRQRDAKDAKRLSLRAAPLCAAGVPARLRDLRQPRGDVVSGSLPAGEARYIGQTERHDGLAARNQRLAVGDTIALRIHRDDRDATAAYQDFAVPYRPAMRVLDALNWVAENAASDLAYRWFCGSKMCGSCAVRMNGREVRACWEAVEPR